MTRLDKQINYWAHMLDESFGNQSNVPQYTGKLDGYKWVVYQQGNITENQYIQTFDSEQAAIQGAYDGWFDPKVDIFGAWYGDSKDWDDQLESNDAFEFFKKNKWITSTDHTSFECTIGLVKIKSRDMQKLIDLICNYPESPGLEEFDGNNFTAMDLFEFGDNDEWDEFDKLTID